MEAQHIKVTNIPENVHEDYLLMTFDTVLFPVKTRILLFDAVKATAIVDVKTSEDVKEILLDCQKRPSEYEVNGQRLHVVEYIPLPLGHDECTIQLTGNVTKEQVELFFKTQMNSIHGKIKHIEDGNFKSTFRVSFHSKNDAQAMVEGSPYHCDGQELQASAYQYQTRSYTDRILIKGLSPDTTKDCLFNYLEAKVHAVPDKLAYGTAIDTAMVTFCGSLDFTKLEAIDKQVLDESELNISRIPISNCIHVTNIDENISDDRLRHYFENHDNSNGGEVKRVLRIPEENAAFVYFKDCTSVDDVLAKQSHIIEDQAVAVYLYIASLGNFKAPPPVLVTDEQYKILFMKNSRFGSELERHLAKEYCIIEWLTEKSAVELKCTLTEDVKCVRKIAQAWESKIKKKFRNFLESNMHLEIIQQVEQATWDCLIEREQQLLTGEEDVKCYYDQQSILVIGSPQKFTEAVASTVVVKVGTLQTMTTDHIALEKLDLKVLHADNFKNKIHTKFPNLKFDLEANTVHFEGFEASVIRAKRELAKRLKSVATNTLTDIPKFANALYTKDAVKGYIEKKLQNQNLLAVWDLSEDDHSVNLTIVSLTPNSIDDCVNVIRNAVQERQLKITSDSVMILRNRDWNEQVDRWEQQFSNEVLVTINDKDLTVVVCGTDENIKRVYIEVDSFISPMMCAFSRIIVEGTKQAQRIYKGIYTVKGDITDVHVDAFVNSTDERMKLEGSLGLAIKAKGAPHIEEACRRYIEDNERLSEGEVFVSEGGGLIAKSVVHAVGPVWHEGQANESSILEETVRNAMQKASDRHAESVAIPAISCGVRGYPVADATRTIAAAVRRFLTQERTSTIREVYLCDVVIDIVESFTDALKATAGSGEVLTLTNLNPHTPEGSEPRLTGTFARGVVANAEFNRVKVSVVAGDIADEEVGIIVNVTPRKTAFIAGDVSVSLNRAAGPGLQQELIAKYPKGIEAFDVAETDGHNLPCEKVLHSTIEDLLNVDFLHGVRGLVSSTISRTERMKKKSIAIPVIPAAAVHGIHFSVDDVAKQMLSEVISGSTIYDVRFIIQPQETNTIENARTSRADVEALGQPGHLHKSDRELHYSLICP